MRSTEVVEGTALYILKGVVHWFGNADDRSEVEIVGCHAPAGSLEEGGYHYHGEITSTYRQARRR